MSPGEPAEGIVDGIVVTSAGTVIGLRERDCGKEECGGEGRKCEQADRRGGWRTLPSPCNQSAGGKDARLSSHKTSVKKGVEEEKKRCGNILGDVADRGAPWRSPVVVRIGATIVIRGTTGLPPRCSLILLRVRRSGGGRDVRFTGVELGRRWRRRFGCRDFRLRSPSTAGQSANRRRRGCARWGRCVLRAGI